MCKEDEYKKIVGEFIVECNEIEHVCRGYVISHYIDINNTPLLDEFVENFMSKQSFTFQSSITIFRKLISKNHSEFQGENKELINKNVLNKIIELRNILAHSSYISGKEQDNNFYYLNWFNTDGFLKRNYNIDDSYCFMVKKSLFTEYLDIIKKINKILVKQHLNIILKKVKEK